MGRNCCRSKPPQNKSDTSSHVPRSRSFRPNNNKATEIIMPITRTSRARVSQGAVIFNIADLRLAFSGSGDEYSCYICKNAFCASDVCPRTATETRCCGQVVCCECSVKFAKRCRCADNCDVMMASCPYCRETAPIAALDIYLGTRSVCSDCLRSEPEEASATHTNLPGTLPPSSESARDEARQAGLPGSPRQQFRNESTSDIGVQ